MALGMIEIGEIMILRGI